MTTKIAQAGDVNFKRIRLMNGAGSSLDIQNTVVNIDLYESLFRPSMTGSILITDSNALMSTFPIIGEELLWLEFETPETGFTISKTFYINKLDLKISDNNKAAYVLHFTTANYRKDINQKHSRAYSGYASDIVETLFKKVLTEGYPDTEDNIYIEKTANKIKFISNFWSPFKCIQYCANNSVSSNDDLQSPSFIFYEDNKKYNFRTTGDLIAEGKQTASNRTFYYDAINGRQDAANGTQQALIAKYETILKLKVVGGFNYFNRHEVGAWSNRVVEFDILRKAINTRMYDYWADFNKSEHLGEFPAVSNLVQYDEMNSHVEEKTIFTHAHENIMDDQRGAVKAKRKGLMANLEYMSLEIEIHGRTDLVVGSVIDLRLQNFSAVLGDQTIDKGLDQLWSGTYLVTEILHRMAINKHSMVLTVTKDGVNKQITFPEQVQ